MEDEWIEFGYGGRGHQLRTLATVEHRAEEDAWRRILAFFARQLVEAS